MAAHVNNCEETGSEYRVLVGKFLSKHLFPGRKKVWENSIKITSRNLDSKERRLTEPARYHFQLLGLNVSRH